MQPQEAYRLDGMTERPVAIVNGGDGPFPIMVLGENHTIWGASYRYPQLGLRLLAADLPE
jgi:hypothetical protein